MSTLSDDPGGNGLASSAPATAASSPAQSTLSGSALLLAPATTTTNSSSSKRVGFLGKITQAISSLSSSSSSITRYDADDDDAAAAAPSTATSGIFSTSLRKTGGRRTRTAKSTHHSSYGGHSSLVGGGGGGGAYDDFDEQRRLLLNQSLTQSERAFLPAHVRDKLVQSKSLPDCPLAEQSEGVVLFADISGFTHLGKLLRSKHAPLEAAAKLANRIGLVLRELTTVCVQEYGGDVVKFAGDALLCVFPYPDDAGMSGALARAKACAVAMLRKVKEVDSQLDLHGGIAWGKLLHLHLGDTAREAMWYVLTGDAAVRAVNLVEAAARGQILLDTGSSIDTLTVDSAVDEATAAAVETTTAATTDEDVSPKGRAYIPRGLRNVLMSETASSSTTSSTSGEMRTRVSILFATLPSLSMSPEEMSSNSLSKERKTLLNTTFSHITQIVRQCGGEFRDLLFDDKGCIFIAVFGAYAELEMAELKALKAARRMQEELEVEELKIGLSVGTCFVGLVGNETRLDMIVMGNEVNMAARYMGKAQQGSILCSQLIMQATKDFFQFEPVLLDLKKKQTHTPTTPLLAPEQQQQQQLMKPTSSFHRFELYDNDLLGEQRKPDATPPPPPPVAVAAAAVEDASLKRSQSVTADPNGLVTGYRPLRETTKRGSFYAMYRYVEVIPDSFFQGRKDELKRLQAHIQRGTASKQFAVGFLAGPRGYGKSWLVRELRRKMTTYSFFLAVAFELNMDKPLYALRQLVESMFEAFDGMPKNKASTLVAQWQAAGIKLDYVALETLLPYVAKLVPEKPVAAAASAGGGGGWGGKRFGGVSSGSMRASRLRVSGGSFSPGTTALGLSSSSSSASAAAAPPVGGGAFEALANAMSGAAPQPEPLPTNITKSHASTSRLKRQGDSAPVVDGSSSPLLSASDSYTDLNAGGGSSRHVLFKGRAQSLVEDAIEEEDQEALPAERLGSSATSTGPPPPPSVTLTMDPALHHLMLNNNNGGGGRASVSRTERGVSVDGGGDAPGASAVSRRGLFSSFRAGSVVTRGRSPSTLFGAASPPPPAPAPAPAAAPLKPKKSFMLEKQMVKGKHELEGLVKLVSALFEVAAKEAVKVGKKGLVLVIEDIQWLDIVSLQVLCEMVERELFPPQVYVLFSMRSQAEPMRRMDDFLSGGKKTDVRSLLETELRDSCRELKNFAAFEVDVLSRADTDQLVSKLLVKSSGGGGDTVSDEVKDDVFAATGGMPNAIADVVDLIRANDGAVFLDPHSNQWRWKTVMPPTAGAAKTTALHGKSVLAIARQAYLGRIDHLDLETREFLKIAACLVSSEQHKTKFKLEHVANQVKRDWENRTAAAATGGESQALAPPIDYIAMRLESAVDAGLLKNRAGLFNVMEEWSFPSTAICETVLQLVPADRLREIQEGVAGGGAVAAVGASSN